MTRLQTRRLADAVMGRHRSARYKCSHLPGVRGVPAGSPDCITAPAAPAAAADTATGAPGGCVKDWPTISISPTYYIPQCNQPQQSHHCKLYWQSGWRRGIVVNRLCLVSTIPLPLCRCRCARERNCWKRLSVYIVHRDEETTTLIGCPPTAERQRNAGN